MSMDARLRRRGALGAAIVALCLVVLASLAQVGAATRGRALARASSPARASSAHLLGGVNIEGLTDESTPAQADRSVAQARLVHARVVRVDVPWPVLEPLSGAVMSATALAFADRLVADASAAGIGVIMTVDSSPCWASAAPAQLLARCVPGADSAANHWPPSDASAYAKVVSFLATRYGTRLAALEIWNEPDQSNELHFAGPSKPQRYAAILRAAYVAIKQANPAVTVLGGSLVGSNGAFLKALYAAGIKGYYDGLAVHFYNLPLASLRSIHEVQVANGDKKPLWLDEFGWSSCYPQHRIQEEQPCVTPQVQASNLTNIFRSLRRTSYVAAAAVFTVQDVSGENFGVFSSSGARKLSFSALAAVLASPSGAVGRVKLDLRARGGRMVASGSGPTGDFMELEALVRGRLRYRALFVLDRFNRYSITLPRVLGTHGVRVRVYQYWAGAAKAAQRGS
jgi:hypothetical protein